MATIQISTILRTLPCHTHNFMSSSALLTHERYNDVAWAGWCSDFLIRRLISLGTTAETERRGPRNGPVAILCEDNPAPGKRVM
jgi:hypothetical protein